MDERRAEYTVSSRDSAGWLRQLYPAASSVNLEYSDRVIQTLSWLMLRQRNGIAVIDRTCDLAIQSRLQSMPLILRTFGTIVSVFVMRIELLTAVILNGTIPRYVASWELDFPLNTLLADNNSNCSLEGRLFLVLRTCWITMNLHGPIGPKSAASPGKAYQCCDLLVAVQFD